MSLEIDFKHYENVDPSKIFRMVSLFRAEKLPCRQSFQLLYFDLLATFDGSVPSQELLDSIGELVHPDNIHSYGKTFIPHIMLENEDEDAETGLNHLIEKYGMKQVHKDICSYLPHDGMPNVDIYSIPKDNLFKLLEDLDSYIDMYNMLTQSENASLVGYSSSLETIKKIIPAWIDIIKEEESQNLMPNHTFYLGVHGNEYDVPDWKKIVKRV